MKIYLFLLCGIITITACSKDEDSDSIMTCSKSQESFTSDNGTKLELDIQNWYLEKNEIGGGSINLLISGLIIGDSATIRTYGDGLIIDSEIEISSNKEFNQDVSISFTATSLPEGDIVSNTLIYVYGSNETLEVELESCLLRH